MSPILLRPVREQLEHDRVIRLLQAKLKRRYQVGMNPGAEVSAPVGTGEAALYPDLVLTAAGARKPEIIIEVETAESVNKMEAMFEWGRFAQERSDFHLYVPVGSVDSARRLCQDNGIVVQEIWTYDSIGDQTRFIQVYKAPQPAHHARHATPGKPAAHAKGKPAAKGTVKAVKKAPAKPAARPAKKATAASKPAAKPAAGRSAARPKTAASPKSKRK